MQVVKLILITFLTVTMLIPAYAKSHKGAKGHKGAMKDHGHEMTEAKRGPKAKNIVDTGWERKADTNGDGEISEAEYIAYRESLGKGKASLEPMEKYFSKEKNEKEAKTKKDKKSKKERKESGTEMGDDE